MPPSPLSSLSLSPSLPSSSSHWSLLLHQCSEQCQPFSNLCIFSTIITLFVIVGLFWWVLIWLSVEINNIDNNNNNKKKKMNSIPSKGKPNRSLLKKAPRKIVQDQKPLNNIQKPSKVVAIVPPAAAADDDDPLTPTSPPINSPPYSPTSPSYHPRSPVTNPEEEKKKEELARLTWKHLNGDPGCDRQEMVRVFDHYGVAVPWKLNDLWEQEDIDWNPVGVQIVEMINENKIEIEGAGLDYSFEVVPSGSMKKCGNNPKCMERAIVKVTIIRSDGVESVHYWCYRCLRKEVEPVVKGAWPKIEADNDRNIVSFSVSMNDADGENRDPIEFYATVPYDWDCDDKARGRKWLGSGVMMNDSLFPSDWQATGEVDMERVKDPNLAYIRLVHTAVVEDSDSDEEEEEEKDDDDDSSASGEEEEEEEEEKEKEKAIVTKQKEEEKETGRVIKKPRKGVQFGIAAPDAPAAKRRLLTPRDP